MTGRERILTVLNRSIPDRVPVSLFIQEDFLAYFFPDRKRISRVADAVECADLLGIDVITRGREFEVPHFFKKSHTNWQVDVKSTVDGSARYYFMEISTPEGVLKQTLATSVDDRIASGIHNTVTEHLLKDKKDIEIFFKYVPEIDGETIREFKEYSAYSKKVVGNRGITAPWGWSGVFNQVAELRNIQDVFIDVYDDEDFYRYYMNSFTALIKRYNELLTDTDYDCIGIQGNIANSSIIGKDFFDKYVLPYEKELVSAIKKVGKPTIYHNCGKAKVLQRSYVEMGIDIWETVAEPPLGDNDLESAKKEIGKDLILLGNLEQVNFLKNASIDDIEKEVMRIMAIGKPGGNYIFGTADYLEKNTPVENIKKVVEVAVREGRY